VRRALAARPEDRFASAADFAEALEQAARTYNLVATVRTAAAFVNEMIGMDISQQREIVRAWLGRSDVSKSGILGRSQEAPTPMVGVDVPTPQIGSPQAPAPAAELSSLVDDELDMATRVDDPGDEDSFDATRVGPRPDPSSPRPLAEQSGPLMSIGQDPRAAYTSIATAREFAPMGQNVPQNSPAFQSTLTAPAHASGPFPPAPVAFPWPPIAPPAQPAQPGKRGLPVWALLIPAVIIIGGAVFLGIRQSHAPQHPPPIQAPQATPTKTTVEVAPTVTVTAEPPATTTATALAAPTTQPTAQVTQVTEATPTVEPTARPPATSVSRPHPRPTNTTNATNPAAVDNKEFGGRR